VRVPPPGRRPDQNLQLARAYQNAPLLPIGDHLMDQFTYAERATDWRVNNDIAESILEQLKLERYPCLSWIVVSAGTGGTAATMGRYIRYQPTRTACTRLAVVDPEHSVFFDAYKDRERCHRLPHSSRIQGTGRPIVEASVLPDTIDRMIKVPDALSLATMCVLAGPLGAPGRWLHRHQLRRRRPR
jgi:cysteine synthase A